MRLLTYQIKRRYLLIAAGTALLALLYYFRYDVAEKLRGWLGIELPVDPRPAGVTDLEWCEHNYGEEVMKLARENDVPYAYLMSLIVLECRGNKPAGNRFERRVYLRLTRLKEGKRIRFENIKREDVEGMDDKKLKEMATSWVPFQIMGYKAIALGVEVGDLSDDETAAEIGVQWIVQEYGHFLQKKKFQDAFHFHNTGKRFPLTGKSRTHNPYYVSNGMRYMKYFEKASADSE